MPFVTNKFQLIFNAILTSDIFLLHKIIFSQAYVESLKIIFVSTEAYISHIFAEKEKLWS